MVKKKKERNLPVNSGDPGSLGQKYALEKEMATLSSILAWRIPWKKEFGGLTVGTQRVGHNLETRPPPPYLR